MATKSKKSSLSDVITDVIDNTVLSATSDTITSLFKDKSNDIDKLVKLVNSTKFKNTLKLLPEDIYKKVIIFKYVILGLKDIFSWCDKYGFDLDKSKILGYLLDSLFTNIKSSIKD